MMKIYCKRNEYSQDHDFYLMDRNTTYYIFSQKFRKGVEDYYKNGVLLNKAIDHSACKKDCAVHRTMEKLKLYIRYIEKENGIIVFNKTRKKQTAA